jgi:hypothetical protein
LHAIAPRAHVGTQIGPVDGGVRLDAKKPGLAAATRASGTHKQFRRMYSGGDHVLKVGPSRKLSITTFNHCSFTLYLGFFYLHDNAYFNASTENALAYASTDNALSDTVSAWLGLPN